MTSPSLVWAPAYPENPKRFVYREPERKTRLAAAYDLYLQSFELLAPGEVTTIDLGLLCAMPEDERAIFGMRSGLAKQYGFKVLGGWIDADYDQSWKLMISVPPQDIRNDDRCYDDPTAGCSFLRFEAGERIAQVKFEKVPAHTPRTGSKDEVLQIIRGYQSNRTGGFGSTGS